MYRFEFIYQLIYTEMLWKIAWKNIIHKPLNTSLCVCLLIFGVAIISLLLLIQHQLEQKFERDLQNIDVVIGAKGSPLQLVLSAIYHLDAPTGNIKLEEARKIMKNPYVKEAIPLAFGDSYMGFRILGTTEDYLNKYNAKFLSGSIFSKSMEAIIGSDVALRSGGQIGSTFMGTHGDSKGGHIHENHPYTVVGILKKTNTVLDQLVLTNIESVWQVHSQENAHQSQLDTIHASSLDFDHDHKHTHDHEHTDHIITADSMEITAILLQYKSKMSALNMPRIINEQTNMQAVLPALEINRLFYMLGIGATTLKFIAGGIMLMAGFSVFFVLYGRLRERKYELALMRSVGYQPRHLFSLLVLEGVILAALGYVIGWILSRIAIHFINQQAENNHNLQFGKEWIPGEEFLLILTFLIGIISALIPAWQAMRLDVSEIISEK
jgi:putative ABC transport system permease protein